MKEDNFSAAEVFLAACREADKVRLLGVPGGDGSGFVKPEYLNIFGLLYQQSQMASLQPVDRLYDGNCVFPDVEVVSTLEDYLEERDCLPERALDFFAVLIEELLIELRKSELHCGCKCQTSSVVIPDVG